MNRITKLVLLAVVALLACISAMAQPQAGYLFYAGKGDYSMSGKQLSEEELFNLIGEKTYYETYLGAQKQRKVGLPVGIVGAGILGATTAWYLIGIDAPWIHESTVVVTSSIGWTLGTLAGAGLAYYCIGNARLKWIAEDYNRRTGIASTLSFGPAPHGVGLTLNF